MIDIVAGDVPAAVDAIVTGDAAGAIGVAATQKISIVTAGVSEVRAQTPASPTPSLTRSDKPPRAPTSSPLTTPRAALALLLPRTSVGSLCPFSPDANCRGSIEALPVVRWSGFSHLHRLADETTSDMLAVDGNERLVVIQGFVEAAQFWQKRENEAKRERGSRPGSTGGFITPTQQTGSMLLSCECHLHQVRTLERLEERIEDSPNTVDARPADHRLICPGISGAYLQGFGKPTKGTRQIRLLI